MSCAHLWDEIINEVKKGDIEIHTSTGLWIRTYFENNALYVDKAIKNTPSSKISQQRKISEIDFVTVFNYYDRWINGESGIRREVRTKSRNTAYIFALISNFSV